MILSFCCAVKACRGTLLIVTEQIDLGLANGLTCGELAVSAMMVFKYDYRGGYALSEMNATLKDYKDLQMRVKDLWWPRGFSFSCSLSPFRQYNATKLPQLQLQLDTFQVELVQNNTGQFSESYDCAGFFTTVIWMGLLVVLLYLVILGTGVFFIYDIRTNDRFDDPKGKTITVTATD
ncbi:hypothetical protein HPB51_003216 [Rhipicephalus microplus]|uniref:V-type proton ATPase subunit S1/VOA1 transmembrane domain-containing protein n=1 Tax=Rhipicephalus microplus TaxID=6941 RepID=A0A9J6DFI6_RHIMP|nr:hypothetical protein HPB51_003216 [Rhipicephalus microplus]